MLSRIPFQCPEHLLAKAGGGEPVPTVVAGAATALAMEAAHMATDRGLITPVLVGEAATIRLLAERLRWPLSSDQIVSAADEREAAGIAVALVRQGRAAAIMKGQVHTDTLLRAVLDRKQGLRTGRRLSHIFHMTIPDRPGEWIITDAAVNVNPSPQTRLDIIRNGVSAMHALGHRKPKVALLSATELENESMPSSIEAGEVSRSANEGQVNEAMVFGPLAMDNAVSPTAAAVKNITHPVAGHADILVVPNIETGNVLYKSMVYLNSACAAGIVMGAKVPIILTSRADPPEARLASTALAAIVARYDTDSESM